jgi:hypothetical protein
VRPLLAVRYVLLHCPKYEQQKSRDMGFEDPSHVTTRLVGSRTDQSMGTSVYYFIIIIFRLHVDCLRTFMSFLAAAVCTLVRLLWHFGTVQNIRWMSNGEYHPFLVSDSRPTEAFGGLFSNG